MTHSSHSLYQHEGSNENDHIVENQNRVGNQQSCENSVLTFGQFFHTCMAYKHTTRWFHRDQDDCLQQFPSWAKLWGRWYPKSWWSSWSNRWSTLPFPGKCSTKTFSLYSTCFLQATLLLTHSTLKLKWTNFCRCLPVLIEIDDIICYHWRYLIYERFRDQDLICRKSDS